MLHLHFQKKKNKHAVVDIFHSFGILLKSLLISISVPFYERVNKYQVPYHFNNGIREL